MDNTRRKMWVRYFIPSYLYAALIIALSSYSLIVPPSLPACSDEWIHFLEYSIFGFLLARSYSHARGGFFRRNVVIVAALTGAIFGFFDELYQNSVPHRGLEAFDLLADTSGSLVGAIIYRQLYNLKQKLFRG